MKYFLPLLIVLIITSTATAQYVQVSNLPCFYITTTDSVPIVSTDVYVPGKLVVAGSSTDQGLYNGDIEIRGRGNSTWALAKKPYRIKLASKYKLLGMPAKEKSWVLLANYADKSLIRNALAFEASKFMGFTFTPSYRYADVYINGVFQGNYMVTDQVEVQPDRINVEAQDTTMTTEPNITGGYEVQVDGFAEGDPVWFRTAINNTPISIKYPGDADINAQQRSYITNYFQQFENALYSPVFKDSAAGYRSFVDMKSFTDYYIISEMTANSDAFWSSYMYKHRSDPKLYEGPVWDYDIAFNNDNRIGDETYQYMVDHSFDVTRWFKQLINDPYFYLNVKQRWGVLKSAGLLSRLTYVTDSLSTLLQQSAQLNYQKWQTLDSVVYLELAARGSYSAEVKFLRDFTTTHYNWLDNAFQGFDSTKLFTIANVNSGKLMDIGTQSVNGNASTVQFTANNAPSQQWKLVSLNTGYYKIVNNLTGLALGNGNTSVRGTQLQISAWQDTSTYQQWRLTSIGGGKYGIVNRGSKQAADVSGESQSDNAAILQWDNNISNKTNQQWTLSIADTTKQDFDSTKYYTIANVNSSKLMDVSGQSTTSGAGVVQFITGSSQSQQWKLVNLNNGYYKIINKLSSLALGNGNTSARGNQLQITVRNDTSGYQQWRIISIGGGKYGLVNRGSAQAADVSGSSQSDNAVILQWDSDISNKTNQQWTLNVADTTKQEFDSTKYYTIANVNSSKLMDVSGQSTTSGTGAVQFTASNSQTQQWKLVSLNNGYYKIINRLSNFALGNGNTSARGNQLQITVRNDTSSYQQWRIVAIGNGKYGIVNRGSTQAADVWYESLSDNAIIVQWDNDVSNKPNQQWTFNLADTSQQGFDSTKLFTIANVNSGKLMDIGTQSANGNASTIQLTASNAASQQWKLVDLSNGYYKIVNNLKGLALGNNNTSVRGNQLQISAWQDSNTYQQWRIISIGSGKYGLVNRGSTQAVDVWHESLSDSAIIVQWDNGIYAKTNQQWTITITAPTAKYVQAAPMFLRSTAKVYPNPATGQSAVTAECELTQSSKVVVTIHNMLGTQFSYTDKGLLKKGRQQLTIPVGNLSKGIYILTISAEKQQFSQKLYIK